MLIKPHVEKVAKIVVVGVGGGGNNALNYMINERQIQGVDFVAVNTDSQDLELSKAPTKIQIGRELTKGLGSGADPNIGGAAAEEDRQAIAEHLAGADMVFVTAGMGGGTGTGAAPIICEIARSIGALTIGVFTKPFQFEGKRRMENAEIGLETLQDKLDAIITIPNQRLIEFVERRVPMSEALALADSVLAHAVQGISDIIVFPGHVNVDFADVKTIMTDAGSALMGIGIGEGEDRAIMAAKNAITSPLLDLSIAGARGILFNITASPSFGIQEFSEAAEVISQAADPDANIIFGHVIDENIGEKVKVTVIATGFGPDNLNYSSISNFQQRTAVSNQPKEPEAQNLNQHYSFGDNYQPEVQTTPDSDIPDDSGNKDSDDIFDIPAFLRNR